MAWFGGILVLFLTVTSTWSFMFSNLKKRNLQRVSFKECSLTPSERYECGSYGTTEEDCSRRECCWGRSDQQGVPWCYHSRPTINKMCMVNSTERLDCGFYGIRKEQCLGKGCCWQPTTDDSPWCYETKRVPIFEGECGRTVIKPKTLGGRVIGGEEAIPHSWPFSVSLQGDNGHFCGGSLINNQWVLSAAHCSDSAHGGVVVMGAHSVDPYADNDTKVIIPIDSLYPHQGYGSYEKPDGTWGGVEYDVVLIRMATPVEFNDVISPVCLAEVPATPGSRCYSMGWGLTKYSPETGEVEAPELLQQFMSPVVDFSTCNSERMYDGRVSPTSMCAGYEEGGRGNCFGDSGGPLVCREDRSAPWTQVGVVSWGEPCALAMSPTVYAEVSQFVQWMELQIAENE